MIQFDEVAINEEICQNSDGCQCHRLSPDPTGNDTSCQRGCRAARSSRLIIPLRRILMGRRTRIAGLKRRDAQQSPLQPDTTLI